MLEQNSELRPAFRRLTLPVSSCTHPSGGMCTCLCIWMWGLCNYYIGGGCPIHCSTLHWSTLGQDKKNKQTAVLQRAESLQTCSTTLIEYFFKEISVWDFKKPLQWVLLHIVLGCGNCVKNNSCDLLEMNRQVLACELISPRVCSDRQSPSLFCSLVFNSFSCTFTSLSLPVAYWGCF